MMMNFPLRYQIEQTTGELKANQAVQYTRVQLEEAFPPTGGFYEHALMRAMALANGGNRPEPVMSTEDQVRQFAARGGLNVVFSPMDGHATFEPKRAACEKCHCVGKVQLYDRPARAMRAPPGFAVAKITSEIVTCDACDGLGYVRAPSDPKARFGDHSASDDWIARKSRQTAAIADRAARGVLATHAPGCATVHNGGDCDCEVHKP